MVMMILLAGHFEAALFNLNAAQKLVQTLQYRSDRTAGKETFFQCSKIIFKINYFSTHTRVDKFYFEIANFGVNKVSRRSQFNEV